MAKHVKQYSQHLKNVGQSPGGSVVKEPNGCTNHGQSTMPYPFKG